MAFRGHFGFVLADRTMSVAFHQCLCVEPNFETKFHRKVP